MSRSLLGGMAASEFLHRHWQKRPLLVRGAWPDIEPCASQRELFELASRSDVESRLVSDLRGEQEGVSWQLCHGPFDEDELPGVAGAALDSVGAGCRQASPGCEPASRGLRLPATLAPRTI